MGVAPTAEDPGTAFSTVLQILSDAQFPDGKQHAVVDQLG